MRKSTQQLNKMLLDSLRTGSGDHGGGSADNELTKRQNDVLLNEEANNPENTDPASTTNKDKNTDPASTTDNKTTPYNTCDVTYILFDCKNEKEVWR